MNLRGFTSDNNSGIHPEILDAIAKANVGHVQSYGDDDITRRAVGRFKEEFGENTDVYFVFNGTGANVLSLKVLARSFNCIICADVAHIQTEECGAPVHFTSCSLVPIPTKDGKLSPELIKPYLHGFDDQHHSQPGIISIAQVTEVGTVYTVEEIKDICDLAHQYGLLVYMDGARLANAAVALNLPFRAFTVDAGVDAISVGGTKNGMLFGEAILFFNPEVSKYAKYFRKQETQLYSKMRFIGAQFLAYFNNQLWKRNAENANQMAKLLYDKVKDIPGITITHRVDANGVFAIVPKHMIARLQEEYCFYITDENISEVRWMTSFDTQEEDVLKFAELIRSLS